MNKFPRSGCYNQAFRLASPCSVVQHGCHRRVQELSLRHGIILGIRLRVVKMCGQNVRINAPSRRLSAADLREQLRADRVLASTDLFEDLADLHDTEESPRLRQQFAERYRRLIGVHPDLRAEFRTALHNILNDGGGAVDDVIELIHRDHENSAGASARS